MERRKCMHVYLLELLQHVHRRTKEQEKMCVNTRILFRTWPKQGDKQQREPAEDSVKVCDTKSREDELSVAEQEELNLLQELLAKAEKAREIQRKTDAKKRNKEISTSLMLEKKNRASTTESSESVKENQHDSVVHCESVTKTTRCPQKTMSSSSKQNKDTSRFKSTTNHIAPPSQSKAPGIIKQTDLNRLLSQSKQTPTDIPKRHKQAPVFLNAPFKTDSNVRVPKKRTSPPIPTRQKVNSGRATRTSSAGRSAKSSVGGSKSSDGISNLHVKSSLHVHRSSDSCHSVPGSDPVSFDDANTPYPVESESMQKAECIITTSESEQISEESFDATISDITKKIDRLKVQKESTMKDKTVRQDEETFNLLTDCKKLSIPVKLRKLYTDNLKLKSKLQRESLTRKIGEEDTQIQFVEKLESQFEVPQAVCEQKKIQEVTNVYQNLLRLMESLNLNDTSGDFSTQHICKVRKYLEFILTSFYNMEKEFTDLSKNTGENTISSEEHRKVIKPDSLTKPSIYWLPRTISDSCSVLAPRIKHLQYHSGKQLQKYHDKAFHLQYLLLQKELMKCVTEELIPLLENMYTQSSEFVTVFQAVYSLLCGGKLFPVIIKDTIKDREQSSDDSVT